MFIFYSIHYPKPEAEHLVIDSMHDYGELMATQPGLLFIAPYPFKDEEAGTLMGVSIWESAEAFQSAMAALAPARANRPSPEQWERQPTEVFTMNSAR